MECVALRLAHDGDPSMRGTCPSPSPFHPPCTAAKEDKPPMHFLNQQYRASLVAQWLRIRLPMQGTRVRALVWEDPTCRGATRPVSHNY